MRIAAILCFILGTASSAAGQHGQEPEAFEPLAISRSHEIELDGSADRVFALMNPEGGNHWTRDTPDYVFGSPDRPNEAMWQGHGGWRLVADYDESTLTMKTVLYIPEVEFMIEEAKCLPAGEKKTRLLIQWRVAGLSQDGNEAVQGFFDTHWEGRMRSIEKTYSTMLTEESEEAGS